MDVHLDANSDTGDLPTDVFRKHGHELIDWIAAYLDDPTRYPVLSQVRPGDTIAALPTSAPAQSEEMTDILADFERVIMPGITHWNNPSFFAYFAISASIPGILGELLAAALDTNAMLWKSSPSATELEMVVLDWLRQALGLKAGWFGVINDTASISTMLALVAARERADLGVRENGLSGRDDVPVLRVYCSEHAHSSVDKGAITVGFGHENVVHIPVDEEFRMRPEALAAAIAEDRKHGFLPVAVVATIGTTSTTSIDPVPAIADICEREGVWLHVDGAYGGSAGIVPELRHYLDGADRADSMVVNPHKWLFTPVDCSVLWVKDRALLKRAFSLVPEYLVTAESGEVVDLMDYGVQLGRRFRSLKLWMVMRSFGTEGLASRIREHVRLAQEFAKWVEAEAGWEIMAPHPFSLVCFRYAPAGMAEEQRNTLNQKILDGVNATGEAFLSHTKLDGRFVLRLAIGNIRTEEKHVGRVWQVLKETAVRIVA
ncbi:MAG: pyridoxal-dependent decarboxylase [Gemmatimonadaceae bacterium]